MIKFWTTKGEYGYLSNFYPCKISYLGLEFPSSEHLYQVFKAPDSKVFLKIQRAKKPMESKRIANKALKRADWHVIKYDVMLFVLQEKFGQNLDLLDKLLATGEEELFEDSPYDKVWGGRDGGMNLLGKALMRTREEFRKNKLTKYDSREFLVFNPDWIEN